MDWLAALNQARAEGVGAVLVTVASVRGHAPREAGAKMVVGSEHTWGTIGGGNLEMNAIERARVLLAGGATQAEMFESRLNPHEPTRHGRQCCGGEVSILLEPIPARATVAIFGVGHVGYELARILSRLPLRLHLVDSRTEQLDPLRLAPITEGSADVSVHVEVLGEQVMDALPPGAHVLVMTHDHAEDFALCDAALRRPPGALASIGLIGSSAKWAHFRSRLSEQGHDAAEIARIMCPIGDPAVAGKEPAMIGIGVAAALVPSLLPAQHRLPSRAQESSLAVP